MFPHINSWDELVGDPVDVKVACSPGTNMQMGTAGLDGEKESAPLQKDGLLPGPASDCLQQLLLLGVGRATGEALLWETCSRGKLGRLCPCPL